MTFRPPIFVYIKPPYKAVGDSYAQQNPLLTPNPARPFIQTDWPSLARIPLSLRGDSYAPPNPLLTPNPARPFIETDWPRTTDSRAQSDIGFAYDYGPVSPTPFSQDLWDNPAAKLQKARVDDFVNIPVAPVVVQNPFSQNIWDNPARGQKAKVDDVENLLTVQPTTPFVQSDWPRSHDRLKAAVGEALGTLNPLLTPNPARPFSQTDWFQIRSTQKAKVDDPYNATIIQPAVVVVVQFSQLDWPSAARSRPKIEAISFAPPSPLLTPNPAQPFNQDLWDSAIRAYPKVIGEVVGTLSPVLTPNPAQPFNQYEWRSTARIPLSLKSDVYAGVAPLLTPNPAQPFRQNLWEGAAKAWPKVVGEAIGTLAPVLTPNPSRPFAQYLWENATFTRKAKVDDPPNLTLILPVTVFNPFYQNDWRSPVPGRPAQKSDTYASPNPLLRPNPALPFNQTDWPRAREIIKVKAIGEPIGRVAPLLTPNPSQPFTQADWPSRIAILPAIKSDIFVNLLPLHTPTVTTLPFNQFNWPSNTGPPRNSDRSFVAPFNPNLPVPPPPAPSAQQLGAIPKWRFIG